MVKVPALWDSHVLPGIICDTVFIFWSCCLEVKASRAIFDCFCHVGIHVDPTDGFTSQQPCLFNSLVVEVQVFLCIVLQCCRYFILLPFFSVMSMNVISPLNEQYAYRYFCTYDLVNSQLWSMSF